MTVIDVTMDWMTSTEQLEELVSRPDGEFTRAYLTMLRTIRPAWKFETDEQLIGRAIRLLKQDLKEN